MSRFFNSGEAATKRAVNSIIERLQNNDPSLLKIRCSQLNLDAEWSEKLFSALPYSTHVKILYFHENRPGDAIKVLAQALKMHPSLQEVYLGVNHLDDEAMMHLFEALKDNRCLKMLDVNTNPDITDVSVPYMADFLKHATTLEKIEILSTSITDEGLEQLLQALESNPHSSLIELCEPCFLDNAYLTQDNALAEKIKNFFINRELEHVCVNSKI